MPNVINPEIRVRVETIFGDVFDTAEEDTRLDMDLVVEKDMTEEPNMATVRIYNLNDTTIHLLSGDAQPNIEIWYNTVGSEEFTSCFVGEIVEADTEEENPGTVTTLICESQRAHCRDAYVELNYEGGTALSLIVDHLTDAIALPVQSCTIPDKSILSALTLTGPAFLNLQHLLRASGLFTYITDGVLYISSVFEPPVDTIVEITNAMLTAKPRPATRRDVTELWYTLGLNDEQAASQANLYAVNKDKVKQTTKQQKLDKNKKLVTVDAIQTEIKGITCECLGIPNLQPDTLIHIEDDKVYYRVQRLMHDGDNHRGIITRISADVFGGR